MRSSTSASNGMTASYAIAMLIIALLAYFLILEVAMRTVVPRLSKGQQRELEDRRAAVLLKPRMPDGSTSMVGNSLLLHGIDRTRLQRAMGSRYHVVLYPVEGTTYLDWYFGLRRLFADGARPSMLVLCISVRQLVYNQTAGEGFAHTMMSIADLPAVVRAGHLDMMTASAYFFANRSAWLGGRSSLRNGLLERWLPNASTLAPFLTVRDPPPPIANPATISRALQRLRDAANLCGSYRARFVFLVPPSANPSDPAEAVRSAAELTGLPVLVPYRSGEMPGAAFSDGFHLNPDGAVLFTIGLQPLFLASLRQGKSLLLAQVILHRIWEHFGKATRGLTPERSVQSRPNAGRVTSASQRTASRAR